MNLKRGENVDRNKGIEGWRKLWKKNIYSKFFKNKI